MTSRSNHLMDRLAIVLFGSSEGFSNLLHFRLYESTNLLLLLGVCFALAVRVGIVAWRSSNQKAGAASEMQFGCGVCRLAIGFFSFRCGILSKPTTTLLPRFVTKRLGGGSDQDQPTKVKVTFDSVAAAKRERTQRVYSAKRLRDLLKKQRSSSLHAIREDEPECHPIL